MKNSLSKFLYELVFEKIVQKLADGDNADHSTIHLHINLLDIAGFGEFFHLILCAYIGYICISIYYVEPILLYSRDAKNRKYFNTNCSFQNFIESFNEGNHFEQLCINYVNEKIQQSFVQLMLKNESDWYARESLDIPPIPFLDNSCILGVTTFNVFLSTTFPGLAYSVRSITKVFSLSRNPKNFNIFSFLKKFPK